MRSIKLIIKFTFIMSILILSFTNCTTRLDRSFPTDVDTEDPREEVDPPIETTRHESPQGDIPIFEVQDYLNIIGQPTSQTIDIAAGLDQPVTFSVVVSSNVDFTYQWFYNGTMIEGAIFDRLELTNVTMANAGFYQVKITNPVDLTQSTRARLTVLDSSSELSPPTITTQPIPLIGIDSASQPNPNFTVIATGDELNYQWWFKPDAASSFTALPESAQSTLNFPSVSSVNVGTYFVTVFNNADTVDSTHISLRLSTQPSPSVHIESVNQVATGQNHTCHIESGALICWGDNGSGQIGVSTPGILSQTSVPGMDTEVTAVFAAGNMTCAIKSQKLYCWGINQYGQVGDGSKNKISAPFYTSEVIPDPVESAALGPHHSCAVTTGGKLYCWGRNRDDYGYTILGDISNTSGTLRTPTPVLGLESGVTQVSLGRSHTCAIQSGALKCWGSPRAGKLGRGGLAGKSGTASFVAGLYNNVTQVGLGKAHACAVHAGVLKCWGLNEHGQVGNGTKGGTTAYPNRGINSPVITIPMFGQGLIGLGEFSSCAFSKTEQKLSCWGANGKGQLGIGKDTIIEKNPQIVAGYDLVSSLSISSDRHRCIRNEVDGLSYCWGLNKNKRINSLSSQATIFKAPIKIDSNL